MCWSLSLKNKEQLSLAMKSTMEIIGADSSLLYLVVYLHGAHQPTPEYLEYPLSV